MRITSQPFSMRPVQRVNKGIATMRGPIHQSATPKEILVNALQPIATFLKTLNLANAIEGTAQLEQQFPFAGEVITAIRAQLMAGLQAGWLTPKDVQGAKFGGIAKDLQGFSAAAVLMNNTVMRHRHPNGEINLMFATKGQPTFDGCREGWMIYPPDSIHTPTVVGGEMLIVYFHPEGAVEIL